MAIMVTGSAWAENPRLDPQQRKTAQSSKSSGVKSSRSASRSNRNSVSSRSAKPAPRRQAPPAAQTPRKQTRAPRAQAPRSQARSAPRAETRSVDAPRIRTSRERSINRNSPNLQSRSHQVPRRDSDFRAPLRNGKPAVSSEQRARRHRDGYYDHRDRRRHHGRYYNRHRDYHYYPSYNYYSPFRPYFSWYGGSRYLGSRFYGSSFGFYSPYLYLPYAHYEVGSRYASSVLRERAMGALDLDVSPGKAEIFVDGQRLGIADEYDGFPSFLWLEEGTYDIAIYAPGYETIFRQYTIYPGITIDVEDSMREGESVHPDDYGPKTTERRDRRIAEEAEQRARVEGEQSVTRSGTRVMEEREIGRVIFDIWPADAAVYLDGYFLGTASEVSQMRAGMIVDPGNHLIEVTRPGYEESEIEFDIEGGERQNLVIELSK